MPVDLTSIPRPVLYAVILLIAFLLTLWVRRIIHRFVSDSSLFLKVDATKYSFIKNAASLIIFSLAVFVIIYSIPEFRTLGTTLLASAGIATAVLAFASQAALSNIVSGVFIVIFKPFRVDDLIRIEGDKAGVVEDITLRHTVIRDFQNQRIIIPNSVISSQTIVNSHIEDQRFKRQIFFGISYDSNIDKAFKIITEEAENHPYFLDGRTDEEKESGWPKVKCRVIGFGDSSVNLRADVWSNSPEESWELFCDINKSVKERFDKEGIEIPFPYRTVVYKKDLPKNG
ncbi:MAG: mechanosensitive ion channel family protein [Flavobacteriales bacterium]|nr:mechanosensitive ion channel family protein [Flavobacteriales bacterium]MCB9190523.1 mechanosensitive ion channel family protein [Flavobacteriales bacterium]